MWHRSVVAFFLGLSLVARASSAPAAEGTFEAIETWTVTLDYRDWGGGFTGTREFTGRETGRITIYNGTYTLANKVGHHLSGADFGLMRREIVQDGDQFIVAGSSVLVPTFGVPPQANVFLGAFIVSVPLVDGAVPELTRTAPYSGEGDLGAIAGGGSMSATSLTVTVQSSLSLTVPSRPPPGQDGPFGLVVGHYAGVYLEPASVLPESSGLIRASVTARGAVTARLVTLAGSAGFSGQLDPYGRLSRSVRLGTNTVQVDLVLDPAGAAPLSGLISTPQWTAAVDALRAAYDATTRPAIGLANRYTLRVRGGAGPDQPKGDGVAAVEISLAGRVAMKGTLADGAPWAVQGALSEDGRWPVYQKLARGRGFILGWLEASPQNASAIQGVLFWSRRAGSRPGDEPGAFDLTTAAEGSVWFPPDSRFLVENGPFELSFSDGDLPLPLACRLEFAAPGKVSAGPAKLQFKLSLFTGLFSGSYAPPEGGRAIRFKGAMLAARRQGTGFFSGTNTSGLVQLR